jgi:1-aminocyclopropane-1-carboxylate deaminase/D-cysteine desulfhydrase-like pyridoxal-dependent ACC family enzyme
MINKTINKFTTEDLEKLFVNIPRKKLLFSPTPFHKLENFSKDYKVDVFMKREELGGPSTFGGNKIRKLEFIMGQALEDKIDYIITYGAYQSNSVMQIATACNICGIKPILFLGDTKAQGVIDEPAGNLLLSRMLDAEIVYVDKPEPVDSLDLDPLWDKVINECHQKKEELESKGYKVLFLPVGSTHEYGFVSDVLMFKELLEQGDKEGIELDYIFHTNGSGGTLPGMIAAKLMTGSKIKIRSINVRTWKEGSLITKKICLERVRYIFNRLNVQCPSDEAIYAEMHIDENYMHPGYGIPNSAAEDVIRELAHKEGLFIDYTYTGKGFSGLKDYIVKGLVPENSKVVFIHTGGTIALFGDPNMVKNLYN